MAISMGLVGMGSFGRQFVDLFQKHPDVSRFAICDIHAGRLAEVAKQHAIAECYDSLDAMLASDLDAVAIITQPWLHYSQVMQTLEAGKHVYSAVPTTYGLDGNELLDQCDALVRQVERTGQLYMLGETTYYRAETAYCRARAAAGDFGHFTYGECEYWHDLDSPYANLREVARNRWGDAWAPEKRGSIPMHYPTHSTGSMVAIMSAHMTTVSARGYIMPGEDWFVPETISGNTMSNEVALYTMSNGALVRHCEFRRVGHPGREGFRLLGTEGCFLSDVSGAKWTNRQGWEAVDLSGVRGPLPEPLSSDLGGHGGSHAYLVNEFVEACNTGRQPATNVWEAVRYVAPGIVAHQSAMRDGETLAIPDWGDAPER